MFYLTDVNGPRVTNSPGFFAAADWAVKRLEEWGVSAHLEKWGPFGRGWTYTHFSAHLIAPQYAPLIGFPLAWTAATNGSVTGAPMLIERLENDADLAKYKGQLKGKIVLIGEARQLEMSMAPLATRYTDNDLGEIATAPDPAPAFGPRGQAPSPAEVKRPGNS